MLQILIIPSVVIMFMIIFAKPKWGTFLIWLVLFTYPHGFWYYRQYLPLNIGFDDLFCILLFLVVLVRRNLLGGVPIRFGYAFWVITAFSIIVTIAVFHGSLSSPAVYRDRYLKELLKLGVFWALFYAILHCIDDEHDLKMQFSMFSIAAVVGAGIVILQYFSPYLALPWTSPEVIEAHGALPYRGRAGGAFLHPNAAACVLVCCAVLVMTAIRLQKSLVSKAIVYTFIFVLLIGVLITKSRAGFMALVGTFVLMAFLGKGKKVAWFIIIAAVIIVISFPVMREAFQERVVRIYDPTTGQWGRNIVARVEIWKRFFGTITPQVFIFGQGAVQAAIRTGGTSHSAYVSLIALYGLGGVVWALIALIIFFRKTFAARHAANPLLSTISAGCIWAILAWGIYGLSADALSSNYPRYLLFYLVVLIDRASYFAGQEQLSWLYDEREEYVEEEYCVYAP